MPSFPPALRDAFERRFGIDTRALAALRVALGVLLLVDIARRVASIRAFYTDSGILPRHALVADYSELVRLSVHTLSGAAWFQYLLAGVAALAALALLAGYRTRLATLVSLVLLISVHVRNPVFLNGGDALLRRLLFWSLFLPLGERWALDASSNARERVASAAAVALLVQVVVVYWVNAAFKLRSDVWLAGDALRYVFRLDQYTWLLGDVLAGHPALLTVLSVAWMGLLAASPFLIVLTGWRRTLFATAFIGAHLGMAVTMQLYLFPFVSVAALLPFLPAGVWDRVEDRTGRLRERVLARVPTRTVSRGWRPFSPPTRRRLVTAVVTLLLLGALLWNAMALGLVPAPNEDVGDGSWTMFTGPPTNDLSVAVEGTTADGERVDPLRGGAFEPGHDASSYPSERWRRYFLTKWRAGENFTHLGPYLCARWDRAHADELRHVVVTATVEHVSIDGPGSTSERVLADHAC